MKILVLKTSSDKTMHKLFKELGNFDNKKIDCLIQSSQIEKYQKEYPYINFINIYRERFENLPQDIINKVIKKKYDQCYLTLSGVNGYNFWNVVQVAKQIRFKKAFFYNSKGEKLSIPKKNKLIDALCGMYIKYIDYVYR